MHDVGLIVPFAGDVSEGHITFASQISPAQAEDSHHMI